MPRRHALLLTPLLALALSGCGADGPAAAASGSGSASASGSGTQLHVATAFYPLEFLAARLAGDAATVENLTSPGAEPHDLELTPQQVARLSTDDLVVYLHGFQPAVDEAVQQQAKSAALDVATATALEAGYVPVEGGVEHADEEGLDPHIWLDPEKYSDVAAAVGARLEQLAPQQAPAIAQRTDELRGQLKALDGEFRRGLAHCERNEIVTSHNAFGYLAAAYGLRQISITGLTPEQEPSPGRLAEVATYAEEHGVTTIFFEELVSPAVAQALASEVGAQAVELSPLEGAPASGDYLTQMRSNLTTLQTALGCSPA